MKLSIVIPYHNEGTEFITTTINSLKETIDVEPYEIIVVDDCSAIPLEPIKDVTVLRHDKNMGVGIAFDTGVKYAQSENIFLMGSDIRFAKNRWASQIVQEIETNPKSFICTSCVALHADALDIEKRRLVNVLVGATILMFHDKKSNPAKNEGYKNIIEAKWLPHIRNRDIDSYEIPCILGAAYGVSKTWYDYVDGWSGHKKWGTLEPYISLKSWFFGGTCRIAPRIETGHIFKPVGTHGTPQDALFYNKMMVATMLIEDYQRLISFLPENSIVKRSRIMYNENIDFILKKRQEYRAKIVYKQQDYFDRFNIDYRPEFK
jgi:glycosyltransferase involved in cell wall biosynthesis